MGFGAPPVALWLAADVLLGVKLRGFEKLLAITATARQNISSEDRLRAILLRKSECRNCYRVLYCIPARGLSGRRLSAAGCCLIEFIHGPKPSSSGARLTRRKCLRFYAPADIGRRCGLRKRRLVPDRRGSKHAVKVVARGAKTGRPVRPAGGTLPDGCPIGVHGTDGVTPRSQLSRKCNGSPPWKILIWLDIEIPQGVTSLVTASHEVRAAAGE